MASQREASPRTRAATALLMLFADDDEDMSWAQHPAAEESAPGDELHDTVGASANDESEGEESSTGGVEADEESDSGRATEAEADEVDEDEEGEANTTTNTASTQAPQPAPEPKKVVRKRWEPKHELVLYLLNQHYDYEIRFLAKVFNRVFRAGGIVRTDHALHQRWWKKKAEWRAGCTNLSQTQQAMHQKYRRKIDTAIAELNNGD
jgi:hypothetical protein